jgi:hypothetical protein
MEKRIKIFKSFEEQEEYALKEMKSTTPKKRFENLYRMQKISSLFKKNIDTTPKILIKKNGLAQ